MAADVIDDRPTGTVLPTPNEAGVGLFVRDLRILSGASLAGLTVGFLVNGLGVRLAMRLLFLLNPEVKGVTSDDGFVMGQFTVGDTLTLVAFATFVGVIGAMVYLGLRPLRFGPDWFHKTAFIVGPAVVVGNMLVHSDGIDFRVLHPTTLAIALFVALPAASAAATITLVERWTRPDAWVFRSRRLWVLGLVVLPALLVGFVLVAAWLGVRAIARTWPRERVEPIARWSRGIGRASLIAVFAITAVQLGTTITELL